MSGQLVGEVIDALGTGAIVLKNKDGSDDLASRLALIAIAERCYTDTRQGSVRKARIESATGKADRTVDRIIRKLKDAGLIRVVKPGHKPPGGDPVAPLYELSELSPSKVAEASAEPSPSKVADASAELSPNPAELSPNRPGAFATDPPVTCSAATYDGTYDGTTDATPCSPPAALPVGVDAEVIELKPKTDRGTRLPEDWFPPQDVIDRMRVECPHLYREDFESEHRKFIDYWTAQPGQRGRKSDWPATWRNWIRRAAEQQQRRDPRFRPSTSQAAYDQAQALKRFYPDDDEPPALPPPPDEPDDDAELALPPDWSY